MFINTISYDLMLQCTCNYFKITSDELKEDLKKIESEVNEEGNEE